MRSRVLTVGFALACGGSPAPRAQESAPLPTHSAPAPAPSAPIAASHACDQTHCVGRAGNEIVATLHGVAHQTRRKCYEPALASDATLEGHLVLHIKIASSGAICSVNVLKSDMSPAVADCVASVFESAPAVATPEGGCVNVDFPLRYEPKR